MPLQYQINKFLKWKKHALEVNTKINKANKYKDNYLIADIVKNKSILFKFQN